MPIGAVVAMGVVTAAPAGADVYYSYGPDDDAATMTEFIQTVNWVSDTYGTGTISVGTGWIGGSDVFAQTLGRRIVLNKVYSTNPDRLVVDVGRNVVLRWFPGGCSAVATVALHEAGHVVDYSRRGIATIRVAFTYGAGASLRGEVSQYSFGDDGVLDASEAVASAFQAVACNGGTAAERDIYRMLVGG